MAEWWHVIELGDGETSPGAWDLRPLAERIPWPDLHGKRCLDIGTADGFWAFELERRGASEVVAIDVLQPEQWDWPAGSSDEVASALNRRKRGGDGFLVAAAALGSRVTRLERSVYELDPAEDGQFDLVYIGSLLLHLRDPVGALTRVRGVCRGELVLCDTIEPALSLLFRGRAVATLDGVGRPWWWKPNTAGLARMAEAAGFDVVEGPRPLRMPAGAGQPRPRLTPRVLRSAAGREAVRNAWRGDPHAALRAR